MRIQSGAVAMQSDRNYHAAVKKDTVTINSSGNHATVSVSSQVQYAAEHSMQSQLGLSWGDAAGNQIISNQNQQDEKSNNSANEKNLTGSGTQGAVYAGAVSQTQQSGGVRTVSSVSEMKLQILKSLIEMMRRIQMMNAKKGKPVDMSQIKRLSRQYEQARKEAQQAGASFAASVGIGSSTIAAGTAGISASTRQATLSTVWHKTTVESAFMSEAENTAYSAQGIVNTADGRQINFNITVEMSRSFEAAYEKVSEQEYIVTDPLVINFASDTASVTDQKFLFDLDSDGEKEKISFAGEGSGFLALDKNNDGVINDGNELFGTKSGDGFKDLERYDEDGNGWIDEGDSVFNSLKIWTKDENGKNQLLSLSDVGIGAIYLGRTDTTFSLNDASSNETNAVIRKTGIYLREDGTAGTIQHVDLAL